MTKYTKKQLARRDQDLLKLAGAQTTRLNQHDQQLDLLATHVAQLLRESAGMTPSGPATTPPEATPSGSSTSSMMFCLVKEGLPGELVITTTATEVAHSLLTALGVALESSQADLWSLEPLTMSGSQWRFGQTPSTPEVREAGAAGGSEPSPSYKGVGRPDD